MKIAIQGELGSFSHEAAKRIVPGCRIVPCARSAEVFKQVLAGSADAAVIPIENSLAGSVSEHYDLLLASKLFIRREFYLRIVHNLIAGRGVRRTDIRRAYSHPVALDQCHDFFCRNPRIEAVSSYDTAGSVKHVVESELRDAAAIAGRRAAVAYHGRILASGIEDDKKNFTRFFLIRRGRRIVSGANKTSIAFSLKNAAGALHKALAAFAARGISLSKIESRPIRGHPWEYVFFVDFMRGDDPGSRRALRELRQTAEVLRVLGVYKAARTH